jgi:hypothetical protein
MNPVQSGPDPLIPVRDGSRYGSSAPTGARSCLVCAAPVPSARARYCSDACKQRAYRGRQVDTPAVETAGLTATPKRGSPAAAQTVYVCPACDARYLGERRCPDCNCFCRKLGPGGACPHCDEPILLAELLGRLGLP